MVSRYRVACVCVSVCICDVVLAAVGLTCCCAVCNTTPRRLALILHRVCVCVCVRGSAYFVCVGLRAIQSRRKSRRLFAHFFLMVAAFLLPLAGRSSAWACADSNAEFCLHLAKGRRQLGSESGQARRAVYPVRQAVSPSVQFARRHQSRGGLASASERGKLGNIVE